MDFETFKINLKILSFISFFILLPTRHNKFDYASDLKRMNLDQFQ